MTVAKPNLERTRKIMKLREQGKTYKEIGKIFSVSPERIRQLYFKELWWREQKPIEENRRSN